MRVPAISGGYRIAVTRALSEAEPSGFKTPAYHGLSPFSNASMNGF